ncbi:phosphodiester glycosidase family protein [Coxiella-like endosymbiont of Rhipicephalus sanguineus]|uniref:phosphodiester glycosidase family protein n=1 Tax=Coxiella-like endosymbiont of Rhipicephalus sanguineus TaxID=1955402 RepID=UPI00203D05C3
MAQRSSLCITKSGKVIIAITDLNLLLTPTQLAHLVKKLDCYNALNLDRGTDFFSIICLNQ